MNEQGSPEWLQERCGMITASRFSAVMAKPRTKGAKWSQAGHTYAMEVAAERLTGTPASPGGSPATDWGHRYEDEARAAYAMEVCETLTESGFIRFGDTQIGGSPDGYTGADGIHEIKCPANPRIHLETVCGGVPKEHTAQIQGNLLITGKKFCDFVSFSPMFKGRPRIYIKRAEADHAYQYELATRLAEFDSYIDSIVRQANGEE